MTPTPDPEAARLERMAEHIARRDRLTMTAARTILRGLPTGDLVRLEMETRDRRPTGHIFAYDPYGR